MIVKLLRIWRLVRSSMWFVPCVIVLLAVLLAGTLIEIDTRIEPAFWSDWPLLFGAGAAGSRGMLSAVAGSMITVAGTVFSITLVVLSLASSQYSSRVLRNFMTDGTNQTVLGIFVGIFAYCLIVMRAIRGGDEGAFVPSLAVLGGILLAFVGIGFLIYFIHHVSVSIQASEILARISAETIRSVDRLFPNGMGEEVESPEAADSSSAFAPERWHPLPAAKSGYIQDMDTSGLLRFATDRDTVVRMERGVGEFVIEGTALVSILSPDGPSDSDVVKIAAVYNIGRQRTSDQDAGFGVRQLVDVALRALSPGINDTTTAVMALDHLGAILVRLSRRDMESMLRTNDGKLRVLARGPTFSSLVGEAFDQIRQNASGNVAVLSRMFGIIGVLANQGVAASRRTVLLAHLESTAEVARRTIPAPLDLAPIEALAADVRLRLVRERAVFPNPDSPSTIPA